MTRPIASHLAALTARTCHCSWILALPLLANACGEPAEPEAPPTATKDAAAPSATANAPTPEAGTVPGAGTSERPPAEPKPIAPTTPHAFTVLDLLAIDRLSDPQVSPDGTTVAFVRRVTDLEADKGRTDIWTVPVTGGDPTRITHDPASDTNPRFSPDGKTLYFLSTRGESSQVWSVPVTGGDPTQLTALPLDVANLELTPDGETFLVSIAVFVDCKDLTCTKTRLDERAASKRSGIVYPKLFVRHWDTFEDGTRSHLFAVPRAGGDPIDLTAGLDADVPSKPFGGSEELAVSPDGKTVVFATRNVGREEAWSTNFDLYAVPIEGGPPQQLTTNPAWDTYPRFSPDGTTLAYAAMSVPGYESDRFALHVLPWPVPPGTVPRPVAPAWDRSIAELVFTPEGKSVLVTADNLGQHSLFEISLEDGTVNELAHAGTHASPKLAGDRIVLTRHDLEHPAELFTLPRTGGELVPITHVNDAKIGAARLGRPEQFSFEGAGGDTVYGYVVAPVDLDPAKRYPVALLIHGGPQGSFGNIFHYRWNPHPYAGAGYAVVTIDFHGSTGYGQRFTDAIQNDWGGKPLVDLDKGLAHALAAYPWLDGTRVCALGASYGGFMVNWIASQRPDRFRCLVNHDGVFELRSMYYSTEELWFPEREFGGPYYEHVKAHERWNPALHVDRWKTPILFVHGGLDYRVPPTQGLAAFTAAQRRGIPSELLYFPDENHWVLKPNNSIQWHETVLAWLNRFLRQ